MTGKFDPATNWQSGELVDLPFDAELLEERTRNDIATSMITDSISSETFLEMYFQIETITPQLTEFLSSIGVSGSKAEDLLTEAKLNILTFFKTQGDVGKYKDPKEFAVLFQRVLKKGRDRLDEREKGADTQSSDDEFLVRIPVETIKTAIPVLTSDQRKVVILKNVFGIRPNDIALIMGFSESNVRMLLSRANNLVIKSIVEN